MTDVIVITIDRTDRKQVQLNADDRITDRFGVRIGLEDVPDALADPSGWIEYDTVAVDSPDAEPWEREPDQKARCRLYARAVVETMLIFDEEA